MVDVVTQEDPEERKRRELREALHKIQCETAKQLATEREHEYHAKNLKKNVKKAIKKEQNETKKT